MEIRVHIQPSMDRMGDGYDIFILEDRGFESPLGVLYFKEDGTMMGKKVEESAALTKPSMRVSGPMARLLFPALVKSLQLDGRFPLDSEASLRGKLEATLGHLADMRKLVFKEKTVITRIVETPRPL